ncbi:MAG: circularly permuted type 2 ATP-grasp protein [Solirubrobacteraceae bacterium]
MAGILDTGTARPFDETQTHGPAYRSLLRQLDAADLGELAEDVQDDLDASGCGFGADARFVIDPVPRVIDGAEWEPLAAGLRQRADALERFTADVYGAQEIIEAGVVPRRVLDDCAHYEPRLRGLPVRRWITVAGLDLVRGADGRFAVLEDNTRTPSGLAYLLAAREAVSRRVMIPAGARLRDVRGLVGVVRDALLAAAPEEIANPHAILLTDGPANAAHWEHVTLGEDVGLDAVTADQLVCAGDRLWVREPHGRRRVDVVYRRTDQERLYAADGSPTWLSELLEAPLRAGHLAVVNAFGAGVADDKLVHAYVEQMVRFYLGEEPQLPSVRTYDLSDDATLAEVLERLDQIVIKPRAGHGGRGVVIGPHATPAELAAVRELVVAAPADFVAQDTVLLSEHPTVADGELAPRHVDLRPFVISGSRRHVVPGGLTRVALEEGEMIVNSSRNGGAKDTWVLD